MALMNYLPGTPVTEVNERNVYRPHLVVEPVPDPNPPPVNPFAERGRWLNLYALHLADAPAPRSWLLKRNGEGVLPAGKVALLIATGGVGKTQLLCQLALAKASQREWLGFTVGDRGRVAIALGEEEEEEIHRRIYRAANAYGLSREEREAAARLILTYPLAGMDVSLTEQQGAETMQSARLAAFRSSIETHLAGEPLDLLIIDPLSRFGGAQTEIDNAAATRFIQALETLITLPGRPVVFAAHHSGKASAAAGEATARGASSITDSARWVAALDADKNDRSLVRLTNTKTNYSAHFDPIWLRRMRTDWTERSPLEVDGVLREETPSETDRRVESAPPSKGSAKRDLCAEVLTVLLKAGAGGKSGREITEAIGAQTKACGDAFRSLEAAGAIARQGAGRTSRYFLVQPGVPQ